MNFYGYEGKSGLGWALAASSASLVVLAILIGELRHQAYLRKHIAFERPARAMKTTEFENEIAAGRKLVILDELVLDVEDFIDQHPGGRFVLQHNIGRDISKFFYGGYSLEDNMGRQPAFGYRHSSYARTIVNDLAVAHYEKKVNVETTVCRVRKDLCETINSTTKVIVVENVEKGKKVANFKKHYKSLNYIAKHFLIKLNEGPRAVARHYTICNAMRPDLR